MSYRSRSSRAALFDDLEEGGLRTSSSYSRDINERDNDKAAESLHERVTFLKKLTGDIHDEVESHNRLLDRTGNDMDASRVAVMQVFEKKTNRRMCGLAASFVVSFLLIYYLIRVLRYFTQS
ncbi:bet1-like SNARE 1-2 isoform X2 [Ziziphus jujuba]|uniref:Bet1-like SNARE 1-2 isoform X2 n=1 Tax=Ziziphus jujuba TaxID=326968 RepID=A0ABM3IQH8_ZIZJJ|nr:bet1-like SNARE 1-2 isoform X2 [Ziziphus jujuba]